MMIIVTTMIPQEVTHVIMPLGGHVGIRVAMIDEYAVFVVKF
jgi:hypothetical protein